MRAVLRMLDEAPKKKMEKPKKIIRQEADEATVIDMSKARTNIQNIPVEKTELVDRKKHPRPPKPEDLPKRPKQEPKRNEAREMDISDLAPNPEPKKTGFWARLFGGK